LECSKRDYATKAFTLKFKEGELKVIKAVEEHPVDCRSGLPKYVDMLEKESCAAMELIFQDLM